MALATAVAMIPPLSFGDTVVPDSVLCAARIIPGLPETLRRIGSYPHFLV